jgi:hypothetical protein
MPASNTPQWLLALLLHNGWTRFNILVLTLEELRHETMVYVCVGQRLPCRMCNTTGRS